MKATQWNLAMASALTALVVLSVPFFAIAQDIDFGGYSDIDFGGFSDIDFGGFSDIDFGGFSDVDFGGFGGMSNTGGEAGSTGSTSGQNGIPGFDPFDGDLGPFDDLPGNPAGDDTMPNPGDGDDDGCGICIIGPPPTVPDDSPDSDDSDDGLGIFISTIFVSNAYDQEPGNPVMMRITFENEGTHDLEDTRVIVVIPELGARDTVGPFDLDTGDQLTKTLLLQLPEDSWGGDYGVRFLIYNENEQRVKHRQVSIIDY